MPGYSPWPPAIVLGFPNCVILPFMMRPIADARPRPQHSTFLFVAFPVTQNVPDITYAVPLAAGSSQGGARRAPLPVARSNAMRLDVHASSVLNAIDCRTDWKQAGTSRVHITREQKPPPVILRPALFIFHYQITKASAPSLEDSNFQPETRCRALGFSSVKYCHQKTSPTEVISGTQIGNCYSFHQEVS